MKGNKAVVISIDAMTETDFRELMKRRNFSSLLSSYSIVRNIECVYPTYTYPCHASIISGCYPDKTGIWHNEKLDITRKRNEWNWWEKDLGAKTIIEYANEHGLTTAAVSWPVTAGGNADYTIPEIWPLEGMDADALYREAVSPKAWTIFDRNRYILDERKDRYYDIYTTVNASDIIREKSPDLTLIHLSAVDSRKHEKGSGTDVLQDAYDFIDECIGKIAAATEDNGTYPDTTFFLLGDHGQMDIKRVFSVNRVLADWGYIKLNGDRIESWRILAHPTGFSSVVYLNGIGEEEALRVFERMKNEYPGAIERIYSSPEAEERWHLSGPFSIILEGTDNTSLAFSPFQEPFTERTDGKYSTHGYAPDKGPKPVFAVCGKRAEKNAVFDRARLVDEGPTILSLFGIGMENTDGKVIGGLLSRS